MLTNDQLLAALKAEGLTVKEYPGWRTLCRCHNGSHEAGGPLARAFDPFGAVMVHITAGGLGKRSAQEYIRDIIVSDPTTPLKAQFVPEPDGTVWIVSGGRCNHAGKCSSRAAKASRGGSLSTTQYQDLRGGDIDGNTIWYGIENIAASKMTPEQEEASVRICAAIARAYGRSGRETIGHGEASNQRSYADPNLNMGTFRARVMARVASKVSPSGQNPTSTKPTTNTEGDSLMAKLTAAETAAFIEGFKAALKDPSVQSSLKVLASGATYGTDFDGNKTTDTVGQLTSLTAREIKDVSAKLDEVLRKLGS